MPPNATALFQKDGLDLTFHHLKTDGMRMLTETGELSRQITVAYNKAASEALVRENLLTESEKAMLEEQQQVLLEQERQKAELFTLRRISLGIPPVRR